MSKKLLLTIFVLLLTALGAQAQSDLQDRLAAWKPAFDPKGAQFTYILSNVDNPAIEGIAVGYHIRDKVWERSGGRLYVDFRPFAQLGGERDVIQKLKLGSVQGMLSSSVAAPNVADSLGLVNLPFIINDYAQLEKFRANSELFREFGDGALKQGIMVVDFTDYGPYGWATTTPVATLEDARKVNFRIAQAPVNTDIYKAWGLKFTVMPWPDVPQALQTGVINGLDHTPIVCSMTRKFDVARYFTNVNYAQGLYIHLMNKRWFDQLPKDLKTILIDTIEEESAKARQLGRLQHQAQIEAAKASGVQFLELPAQDRQRLIELSAAVFQRWEEKIGSELVRKTRAHLAETVSQ
jgi:TRAP-type C4-dicarboxylate transport system substrate-binding protein